jgi:predicted RNA binding protein YcfA (HicA-like mRNA interferase family)
MTSLPALSGREVVRVFESLGWRANVAATSS